MKHFIHLKDISSKDLRKILVDAKKRKNQRKKLNTLDVDKNAPLRGKLLIQMFERSSLRTRLSFNLAIKQLGGGTITLRSNELHLGQGGESLEDTAKILSTYGDGFMLRTDDDKKIDNFAKFSNIPVINGLSPSSHPTQILSDIFTIEELTKKKISKLNICWIGDSNNVLNSLIAASVKFKFNLKIACPKKYSPNKKILSWAKKNKVNLIVTTRPEEAVKNSDCVMTDKWVSMNDKVNKKAKKKILKPFQVNKKLMSRAYPDAIFMHCLPVGRGEEVTDEVIDGKQSVVWRQALNRVHAQKSIIKWCLD